MNRLNFGGRKHLFLQNFHLCENKSLMKVDMWGIPALASPAGSENVLYSFLSHTGREFVPDERYLCHHFCGLCCKGKPGGSKYGFLSPLIPSFEATEHKIDSKIFIFVTP